MSNLNHDPWTKLTDMAAARVEMLVRFENRRAVQQFINELCNNTANKRDVLVKFLTDSSKKE